MVRVASKCEGVAGLMYPSLLHSPLCPDVAYRPLLIAPSVEVLRLGLSIVSSGPMALAVLTQTDGK